MLDDDEVFDIVMAEVEVVEDEDELLEKMGVTVELLLRVEADEGAEHLWLEYNIEYDETD